MEVAPRQRARSVLVASIPPGAGKPATVASATALHAVDRRGARLPGEPRRPVKRPPTSVLRSGTARDWPLPAPANPGHAHERRVRAPAVDSIRVDAGAGPFQDGDESLAALAGSKIGEGVLVASGSAGTLPRPRTRTLADEDRAAGLVHLVGRLDASAVVPVVPEIAFVLEARACLEDASLPDRVLVDRGKSGPSSPCGML